VVEVTWDGSRGFLLLLFLREDGGLAADGAEPGIGTTVFKGIFVRNLARLHAKTLKASYGQFILANARSALGHIDENYQFGCNWAAPADAADFVRQTAGLDLVNAALLVGKTDPAGSSLAGPASDAS
jgi:hypothetical protein